MRYAAQILLFLAMPLQVFSEDVIPEHLIGVWTTDNAVLQGEALFEGTAVYLGADGKGAIVGGPPPIGVRIVAVYDPDRELIEYQMIENGKTVGKGRLVYNPTQYTIAIDDGSGEVLHRKFTQLTESMKKALGLSAEY